MEHSIYNQSNREPVDTLEMHVLAHAYRAAWRSIHGCDPADLHVIERLDVVIEFWPRRQHRAAARVPGKGSAGEG
jgi:hypothetical protein